MLNSTYNKLKRFEKNYAALHVTYATSVMKKEEHERALNTLLDYINSLPSDTPKETKLYVIYRILASNIRYTRKSHDNESFSYLGALRGRAVCIGIAELFSILCKAAGIEAKTVIGYAYNVGCEKETDGENHAWNMVRLTDIYGQERWYHVDVTWDLDEVYKAFTSKPDYGRFYLKDDKYMREHGHFWLRDRYPECNSKTPAIHNHRTSTVKQKLALSCSMFKRLPTSAS